MKAIRFLLVATVVLVHSFVAIGANTQADEPECSRCGNARLTGIKSFQSEVVCASARLGCVDWSDREAAELAYNRVWRFFRDRGFPQAVVGPGEDLGQVVVQTGPRYRVSKLAFAGNATIPDKVLRSVVIVDVGAPYDRSTLNVSILNINELGLFVELTIDDVSVETDSEQHTVDIVFNVRERPLRTGPPN